MKMSNDRIATLRTITGRIAACVFATLPLSAPALRAADKIPPTVYHRTAFLGDSITDGNTYPVLVRDALDDAGFAPMVAINAGIGGDTARGMLSRLERDVIAFHPTLVTLSAGANDTMHGVPADEYEKEIRGIIERLNREHIPVILLTPNLLGPKQQAKGEKGLQAYEQVLRKLAKEYPLRLAEVNQRQKEDLAAGHNQLAEDDLHPDYEGQRMIARAVLDAMGYPELKVPERARNHPLPGVIAEWKLKPVARDETFTVERLAALNREPDWIALHLPEESESPDAATPSGRWLDDYRMLGVSVSLKGRGDNFIGVATINADHPRTVQFHTGAELSELWLNGIRIYQNDSTRGWHPGRASVTATLNPGGNRLAIRCGNTFFLSMTDGDMWQD